MFNKRTRLHTQFEIKNLFHILRSLLKKEQDFLNELKIFLNVENLYLTSQGRVSLFDIIKLIIEKTKKKNFFIAPFTIPEVIYAIKYAGGNVVFIDLDRNTGLIDSKKLENKIDNNSAGVIITHLYSNKENIKNFISKFEGKIKIIEDAAINFGAKIDNKFLGTLADYGFFSFNLVKNLNTLNGGATYIKNKNEFSELKKKLNKKKFPKILTINLIITAYIVKFLSNNFIYQFFHYFLSFVYKKKISFILKRIYPILFHKFKTSVPDNYSYDFNWAMNDVAKYNLKKVKEDINIKIEKAKIYQSHLSDKKVIKLFFSNKENIFLEYPIILKNINNYEMHNILFSKGYDIRHTWYIDNSKELKDNSQFSDTKYITKQIFCLPTHKNIYKKDIIKICEVINNYA